MRIGAADRSTARLPTVAAITIGQSPRDDICDDLRSVVGPSVRLIEVGALDPFSKEEISRLAPRRGEFPLITRLRDGSTVEVARSAIVPLLQQRLDEVARTGTRSFVILCTGEFPRLRAPGLVLFPQRLLEKTVEALGVSRVGVLPPLPGQVPEIRERWERLGFDATVIPASPYGDDRAILEAASQLRAADVEIAILDCQGYRLRHRDLVGEVLDCPILAPTSLIGRIIRELVRTPKVRHSDVGPGQRA